jgi:rhodanese-related sulfurtransferase
MNLLSEGVAVPKGKETVLGLYVTADDAYELWKARPETVKILDVRTIEEAIFVGHPTMAWVIPAFLQTYEWDAAKRTFRMKPNPEFLACVKEIAAPGDTLLVMCRSGGRSALAVNALAQAGFTRVYNIIDGVEGDAVTDPESVFRGQRMRNGWKNAGAPWTCAADPARFRVPRPS